MSWTDTPLRRLFSSVIGGSWGTEPEQGEGMATCVRAADFDYDKLRANLELAPIRGYSMREVERRSAVIGDLIIEKSGGGEDQPVGRVVLCDSPIPVVPTNFAGRLRLREGIDPRYVTYLLASRYSSGLTKLAIKQTTGIQNLDLGQLLSSRVLMPEQHVQVTIANFLDAETARIDALIGKKRRLVRALSSRRQAIINDCVESGSLSRLLEKQGGSTQVPLPSEWSVSRLDHVATVHARIGWKALTASEYVNEGYAFLSTTNLRGVTIDFEDVNYITEFRWLESPELQLRDGDVLMTKDGAGIGWTAVVRSVPRPSTVNGSIAVIRPKCIDGRFLFYALSSDAIQGLVGAFKSGMGVPHLFQADLKKFLLLKPPLPKQIEIVGFLDKETSRIDSVISFNERSILLLEERRQALITAVVTGRFDVPGVAA